MSIKLFLRKAYNNCAISYLYYDQYIGRHIQKLYRSVCNLLKLSISLLIIVGYVLSFFSLHILSFFSFDILGFVGFTCCSALILITLGKKILHRKNTEDPKILKNDQEYIKNSWLFFANIAIYFVSIIILAIRIIVKKYISHIQYLIEACINTIQWIIQYPLNISAFIFITLCVIPFIYIMIKNFYETWNTDSYKSQFIEIKQHLYHDLMMNPKEYALINDHQEKNTIKSLDSIFHKVIDPLPNIIKRFESMNQLLQYQRQHNAFPNASEKIEKILNYIDVYVIHAKALINQHDEITNKSLNNHLDIFYHSIFLTNDLENKESKNYFLPFLYLLHNNHCILRTLDNPLDLSKKSTIFNKNIVLVQEELRELEKYYKAQRDSLNDISYSTDITNITKCIEDLGKINNQINNQYLHNNHTTEENPPEETKLMGALLALAEFYMKNIFSELNIPTTENKTTKLIDFVVDDSKESLGEFIKHIKKSLHNKAIDNTSILNKPASLLEYAINHHSQNDNYNRSTTENHR